MGQSFKFEFTQIICLKNKNQSLENSLETHNRIQSLYNGSFKLLEQNPQLLYSEETEKCGPPHEIR